MRGVRRDGSDGVGEVLRTGTGDVTFSLTLLKELEETAQTTPCTASQPSSGVCRNPGSKVFLWSTVGCPGLALHSVGSAQQLRHDFALIFPETERGSVLHARCISVLPSLGQPERAVVIEKASHQTLELLSLAAHLQGA